MKMLITLSTFFIWIFATSITSGQNHLEVEGKAKITVMDTVNTADSVVVRLADGTLAVRDVSTLPKDIPAGDPVLVGSLGIGSTPRDVYVSGRYAYVVDYSTDDLKIIDVSDPSSPSLVGSLGIGPHPLSVYVSGRYAYIVDITSEDLKVIDVSDPSAPSLAGSLDIGGSPNSVFVSGRYAYVVDHSSNDLKVIDVSDPSAPSLAGSLGIGEFPSSVFVSGRYAYLIDSNELKIIDVSDPSAPTQVGSLVVGEFPFSIYVSGRYAYVVDAISDDLKVIDVSDPSAPSLAGNLAIGTSPRSVYVSGRYAYVVDSNDLKVIDVSDPSAPSITGSLGIGPFPISLFVSGRYAFVVDLESDELKVIEVSGAEVTSLIAHSFEAGNLQVRNDIIAQGQVQVSGGLNVGAGGIFSDGDVGISGMVAITDSVGIGTSSPTSRLQINSNGGPYDMKILFSEDSNPGASLFYEGSAGAGTSNKIHIRSEIGLGDNIMTWKLNGNVGIGKSAPIVALDVEGDINYTGMIMDVSDIRLKENIVPINEAIKKIQYLKGFIYNLKGESGRSAGVAAQDVQKVLPEAVREIGDSYLGVDYTQLVPLLIEGMKQQQIEIDALQKDLTEINQLKEKVALLEQLLQSTVSKSRGSAKRGKRKYPK